MKKLAKSPWMLHYDASSCNGCDIEVLACTTPKYDIERFGIINTGDPFQADILLKATVTPWDYSGQGSGIIE